MGRDKALIEIDGTPMARRVEVFDLAERVCDSLAHDETASSLISASGGAWHLLAR